MKLTKIISGGQAGVDRGALDAALRSDFPCGGWCPPGREAEDGRIADSYPLTEMDHGGYRERTIKNVVDSDATLIITFGEPEGGTETTLRQCVNRKKPHLLINANEVPLDRAAVSVTAFIEEHSVATLNVAGPRASKVPTAHAYALELVSRVVSRSTRAQRVSLDDLPD
jgi:hypothetical protein